MKLYILRHGITEWNKAYKIQGSADVPLAKEGIELAKIVGENIKDFHLDICYSSPLSRAIQTGKLVLGDRDIPIIEDERIAEIDFGELEGLIIRNEEGEFIDDCLEAFFYNPKEFKRPKDGENIFDIVNRTKEFWEEITSDSSLQDKSVLISTHGCAARALLQNVEEDIDNFWRGNVPPNCSISLVEVDGNKTNLIYEDKVFE